MSVSSDRGNIKSCQPLNSGNELLYTGRQLDRETGLVYYRARYYDSDIDRFITEDPLGLEAGVNFYAYVNNNPVNFNDPTGNVCVPCLAPLVPPALEAIGIGIGTSVATGAAIRGGVAAAQGADISAAVFDTNSLLLDAGLGMAGGGFAQLAKARQISSLSSVGKGHAGEALFRNQLNKAGIEFSEQVTIRAGGAKPRIDFVLNTGDNFGLSAAEVKTFSSPLTGPQTTLFNAIDNGGFGLTTGKNAISSNFLDDAITRVNSVQEVRFGAFDFPANTSSIVGGSGLLSGGANTAGGGFVLYPSKPNTNMMKSIYSK